MLLGADLHIYTDHKNLTHKLSSFTTQWVMRWKLILEEFAPIFHYKTGDTNFIADALSRIPTSRTEREDIEHAFDPFVVSSGSGGYGTDPNDVDAFYSLILDDTELAEYLFGEPIDRA